MNLLRAVLPATEVTSPTNGIEGRCGWWLNYSDQESPRILTAGKAWASASRGLRQFGGAGSGWGAGRLCFLPWPGEHGALSWVPGLSPGAPLVCVRGGPAPAGALLPGTVSAGCGGRCWLWSACRKIRSVSSESRKKRNSVSPGGLSGPRHPLGFH